MPDDAVAASQQTVEDLRRELNEALAREAAMAEVLPLINSSPGDLAPVFDAMLEKAMRLCAAAFGYLMTYDGQQFQAVVHRGLPPEFAKYLAQMDQPGSSGAYARIRAGAPLVQIDDLKQGEVYQASPLRRALVDLGGARTGLIVALRKDASLLGVFTIYRREVRPFATKEITLLQNFAAQAVIAVENARLFNQLRESTDELARREAALRASDERYALITEAAAEGIYDWDIDQNRLWVSQRLIELFGWEESGTVSSKRPSQDWNARVHPADFAPYRGALRAVLKGETPRLFCEYRIRLSSGEYRWVEDRAVPVRDERGWAVRLVGAVSDVTDRKEREEVLREALEQQTASAEVLQVINSSPGNLAPIFEAMLERAMYLCDASLGTFATFDGVGFRAVARFGYDPGPERSHRIIPTPGMAYYRLIHGESVVHVADITDDEIYRSGDPQRRRFADRTGARTAIWVALRREAALLGAFVIYRQEVRPFTDKQIALLQNFAAQAVIAMENARLITETREALEQQTATAEVLGVINSSPGDLAPVFDAMLRKAVHLCGAAFGILRGFDGECFPTLAVHGVWDAEAEPFYETLAADPGSALEQIQCGEPVVHITDVMDTEAYRSGVATRKWLVDVTGARTALWVALRKDDSLLGVFVIYRQEVRPFTDSQIALLQNFAAQAVIAMENAGLITETREALDQQTATAEVLGVINSSPGNLAPVFDTILEKAMTLCDAAFGVANSFDGERFHLAGENGVPSAFAEWRKQNRPAFGPGIGPARILAGENVVHTIDLMESEAYRNGNPDLRVLVERGGARTHLIVALRKDDALLGTLSIYRQEVRPFSDKQIALLQNFAAQAVIAIENARLITETREALEQQTATAEVLQVINASPGDLAPVFEAMLEKVTRLCEASFGIANTYDGDRFRTAALHGVPEPLAELWLSAAPPPAANSPLARIASGEDVVHIEDFAASPGYLAGEPRPRAMVELGGAHSYVAVALRKDGELLGTLAAYRQEVHPFTDKQIALLQNFAAQAVIAMENARLITETRDALEQQTATAEVLGVINSSPGDLAPVFDAMLERAIRLCDAKIGSLWIFKEGRFQLAALNGATQELFEIVARAGPDYDGMSGRGRALRGEHVTHVLDAKESEAYLASDPVRRAMVDIGGGRSLVTVSLRKDETVLGLFTIYRQEVRPFTDKQIALLQNFAAQAVIAMENARLITETREALEQQQAIAEILQVINRSPGELQPVFDILLDKAMHLCEAAFGILAVKEGEQTHTVAAQGLPHALTEWRSNHPVIDTQNTLLARVLAGEPYVHTLDLKDHDLYRRGEPLRRANVDLGGARTSLYVPLTRDREVLGTIHIYRQEVRPFSEKQITLLQNFAAQAVIAMDNARLLNEIRQRQAELRVTFDNMADGVVMFDENLRLAAWNRNFQELLDLPDTLLAGRPTYSDYLRILANRGEFGTGDIEAEVSRRLENMDQEFRQERTRPDGRVIEVRRNAVPDGGFVLIYSDITERKRSEAEIRAARDAAEAAYHDLKTAQASLIQAQKMAALGQLTAGIAHEIKNPLNFVNNFAGLSVELLDELKETAAPAIATLDAGKRAEVDETIELLTGNLEKIVEHGQRADGIVKGMLEHSRGVTSERRKVDLNNLVEEALNLAYHGARAQDQNFNITLEREYATNLAEIEVVPQEVNRVFINLIGNGFYATTKRQREDGGPDFRPTLTVATRDLGEAIEVRIRDNGTGIPAEIKDKLFQPFFTTKPTGEGTGLGLSISYDIVTQQHGGTIEVDSRVGEFTEFTVRLPRH